MGKSFAHKIARTSCLGTWRCCNRKFTQYNNRLSRVIDFGILGAGDPACDLVMAWTYFDDSSRAIFMQEMAMDSDTWDRAKGWARWKALITYDNECSRQVVRVLEESY